MSCIYSLLIVVFVVLLTATRISIASTLAPPEPVSPGAAAESTGIAVACPTFSWGTKSDVGKVELVVFEINRTGDEPDIVIRKELGATARTWTPELSQCLAWGEEYGWFLRRLGDEPGPWSEPRYFRLPEAPTEAQAARAANVLKRYLDAQGESATVDGFTAGPAALVGASPDSRAEAGEREASRPTTPEGRDVPNVVELSGSVKALKRLVSPKAASSAALRGIQGDDTGQTYGLWGESPSPDGGGVFGRGTATSGDAPGVVGTSDSPSGAGVLGMAAATNGTNTGVRGVSSSSDGAGVLAENAGGGTDLTLGGSPEAALTESGLTISSSNNETFGFSNSGDGRLVVRANGVPLVAGGCSRGSLLAGVNPDGTLRCAPVPIGLSWVADDAEIVGEHTDIAVRDDGSPIISYHDGGNGNLKIFDCDHAACASGTARTVDDGGGDDVGEYTAIAIRDDGRPIISSHDQTNEDLRVFSCDDSACTSGAAHTVDDGGGDFVGRWTSIAIRDDGTPVISHYDRTNNDLRVFDCDDVDCTTGTPRTADGGNVGQWTGIAVRNDGNPIISYSADGSLKAFDCDDAACSSGTIRTLDDGGGNNVGHYARVAVRDDGTPIFSHYDSIDDDLKVFECDDAACSSGNADIADGGSDNVGRFTDIAVRDNGFPIISYYDDTNTRLKVFDCNSSTCLSGVERSLDDGVDGFLNSVVGKHTGIAVRASGLPVVSYQDETENNVKVFSCGDSDCKR